MDRELIKDIIDTINKNINFYLGYLIQIGRKYVRSYIKYGRDNKITLRYKEVLLMLTKIISEENYYYKILLINRKDLILEKIDSFLNELDDVFNKTYEYLERELDAIDYAYLTGNEYCATKSRKSFPLITETDKYRKEIVFRILGKNILKDYLNYSDEFWQFVDKRTIIIHFLDSKLADFYGVNYKLDKQDRLQDIKVFVPEIVGLKELLINIHEFDHANRLYALLNKEVPDIDYEFLAKDKEKKFLDTCFEPLYKRVFKK